MLGNVFILGDSYSTFEGYIPEGYACYYTKDGPWYLKVKPELRDTAVCDVSDTWWYNLVKENGELIRNCSWSSTTICHTGFDGNDYSEKSFVARVEKLLREGFFKENRVDTVFLFGGSNDSGANAPLGDKIYSDWSGEDLYNVFPAFSYLIYLLTSNLPYAKIYCVLNTGIKEEITDFYKDVCEKKRC